MTVAPVSEKKGNLLRRDSHRTRVTVMDNQELRERTIRDLRIPEMSRIAALLAEVMPGFSPVAGPSRDEAELPIPAAAADVQTDDGELCAPAEPGPPAANSIPNRRITAVVTPAQESQPPLRNDLGDAGSFVWSDAA